MKKERIKRTNTYLLFITLIVYVFSKPIITVLYAINEEPYKGIDNYVMAVCSIIILINYFRVWFFSRHINKDNHTKKMHTDKVLINIAFYLVLVIYLVYFPFMDKGFYAYAKRDNSFLSIYDYYISVLKNTVIIGVVLYIVGENFKSILEIIGKKFFKTIFFSCYFILSFVFLYAQLKLLRNDIDSSLFYNPGVYLALGDIFAFFSLLILTVSKKMLVKFLVFFNATYWLFKIGSRTSLYGFIAVALLYMAKIIFQKYKIKVLLIAPCILIMVTLFLVKFDVLKNFEELNNRMTVLITDVDSDSSYQARGMIFQDGLEDIKEHLFTGKLFQEVRRTGLVGKYIHNIFSYWVEYGIVPFFIIILLSIKYLFISFKNILLKNDKITYTISTVALFFLIICLFSRSYQYPYIWIALTIAINHKSVISTGKQLEDFNM